MNQKTVEAGSALFNAQNLLSIAWHKINGPSSGEVTESAQKTIEEAQDEIRKAIKLMGGVNELLEAGA